MIPRTYPQHQVQSDVEPLQQQHVVARQLHGHARVKQEGVQVNIPEDLGMTDHVTENLPPLHKCNGRRFLYFRINLSLVAAQHLIQPT